MYVLPATLHAKHLCEAPEKLKSDDFPLPVGIPIVIHTITGLDHSVPSTTTFECANMMLANSLKTAVGGILIAIPMDSHACIIASYFS